MFFTRCEYACPILVNELKQLEKALPDGVRDQVDFLLVSFDSERDTPEDLAAYRRTQQLSPDHWTLLRGASDDVRELAALLGINSQKDARRQFAHSNTVTVLNAEGEIVRQFTGLKLPQEDVLSLLRQQTPVLATGSKPGSTSPSGPSKRHPEP
jgi:protein SCO1/2